MNVNAVSANAGLTHVAIFAGHGPFNSNIPIDISKNEKVHTTRQLEGYLFHLHGTLPHEHAADPGGTRNAKLAHNGVRCHYPTNRRSRTSQHRNHPGWHPGL